MIVLSRRAILLALLAVSLAVPSLACRTTEVRVPKKTYSVVFLVTGPNSAGIDAEKKKEVFAGHMANIRRLADEDKLLIAGPFGKEKPDEALRGIFILDTPDLETARTWTNTDPGVQAGEFAAEYARFESASPLRRSLELYREMEKSGQAGEAPGIRGFAMVLAREAKSGQLALEPLRKEKRVSFDGDLEGSKRGVYLAVLDTEMVSDAEKELEGSPLLARDRDIVSWYSVKTVAAIAEVAR
jgi:uncharacterized protein YciI